MEANDSAALERAVTTDRTDIERRDVRALTEQMSVLPDIGRARGAGGCFLVVTQSGSEYLVDERDGRCECADARYRDAQCKHSRRVAFATGARLLPECVDVEAVDDQLGEHVDGGPRVAATDGGARADERPSADPTDADTGDGEASDRPDECDCGSWNEGSDLPCWPCYRDGFESPRNA